MLKYLIPLLATVSSVASPTLAQPSRPPQYIMMSFDGSYTLSMWKATREHGLNNNARYTHFISGVDFLKGSSSRKIPGSTSHLYTPPRWNGKYRSNIGFGGDSEMLAGRVRQVVSSIFAGMEIGGHANGHFDGTSWTQDEWTYEFNLFHDYLWNVISINSLTELLPDVAESDWKNLMTTQHRGFRAPFLGRSAALYKTMGQDGWKIDNVWTRHRYTYDASNISSELSAWPKKRAEGIWDFPLVTIPVPGFKRPILSMDYNFYVAQSSAKENAAMAGVYEEQMYQAYIKWFQRNYNGNRAPLNIGHHFSTWNKGAYWKALQRFVQTVCNLPEVHCITYQKMVDILEEGSANHLANYNAGDFDQSNRPWANIPLKALVSSLKDESDKSSVRNGRYLTNQKDTQWSLKGVPLRDGTDLTKLAKSGTTLLQKKLKGEMQDYLLEWNTALNTVRLVPYLPADIQRCDANAHTEEVDESLLKPGFEI